MAERINVPLPNNSGKSNNIIFLSNPPPGIFLKYKLTYIDV